MKKKHFIILTTLFNGQDYIGHCIESVLSQTRQNWLMFITDDRSTDESVNTAITCAQDDPRVYIIQNDKKYYQNGNYQNILNRVMHLGYDSEECVFIELDGDDRFSHNRVLELIQNAYEEDENLMMTHGSFRFWNPKTGEYTHDEVKRFNRPVNDISNLRLEKMYFMHLRTWVAHLQLLVPPEYLKSDKTGWYYESGGDTAFFIPMMEMAGSDRIKFIDEIIVDYNNENPLNDFKLGYDKQKESNLEGQMKKSFNRL